MSDFLNRKYPISRIPNVIKTIQLRDGNAKQIMEDGSKMWIDSNRRLHRIDGYAFDGRNGNKAWFVNGTRHRLDGPAITLKDKSYVWYCNGDIHRTDGPAGFDTKDNRYGWFIHGKDISKDVEKWMKANDISYPFTPEHQILFQLTWC